MELRKQAHSVYYCDYHMVIATKYRRAWINEGIFAYLELKLTEIRKFYPEIEFKEVNHDKDHLHVLVSIPPTIAVGKVVGIIKQNTARELKQKFSFIKEAYWGTDSVWSDGYFVSTEGIDELIIREYIENQGTKDAGQIRNGFEEV